ncbi:hypothetical protein SB57_04785 [Lactobacillus delbrueckii subsp. bulgaricus]|nr:hypothetical protein SB57_04785 [Lactobacillus delbrueckii subsp. bulgaricus]
MPARAGNFVLLAFRNIALQLAYLLKANFNVDLVPVPAVGEMAEAGSVNRGCLSLAWLSSRLTATK